MPDTAPDTVALEEMFVVGIVVGSVGILRTIGPIKRMKRATSATTNNTRRKRMPGLIFHVSFSRNFCSLSISYTQFNRG